MENIRDIVCKKFREALEKTGTKQNYIAKKSGVTTSTVQRWVKGEVAPTVDNLYLVARAMNLPITYFYGEDDTSLSKPSVDSTIETLMAQLSELKQSSASSNIEDLELQKIADRVAQFPEQRKYIFEQFSRTLDIVEQSVKTKVSRKKEA